MGSLLTSRIPSQYIGFHNLLKNFEFLLNTRESAWPFYSVKKIDDDTTNIYMSLAGFSKDEIKVSLNDSTNVLTVSASKSEKLEGDALWNSLSERNVLKSFTLSPDIKNPEVKYEDGLLVISAKREATTGQDRVLEIK